MRYPRQQSGVSLIETLIAVVVLAVGLLGVAGMQMSALRSNQAAYQRSVAAMLSNSITERMAANRLVVPGGGYNLAPGAPGCSAPTPATLARLDLATWIGEMQSDGMLGQQSCGGVICDGAGLCTITVLWEDERSGTTAEILRMVLEARIL